MLHILVSLFTVINPLSLMPVYIALTKSLDNKKKKEILIKATITAFVTLVIFAVAGKYIFVLFGISVYAIKIVGGVIFFTMGYEMLRGESVPKKLEKETEEEFSDNIAISPLGIPLFAGPGAIAMVIMFMNGTNSFGGAVTLVLSIFIVCMVTFILMFFGKRILDFLGQEVSKILMRVMGLIIMAVAVEFFFSGFHHYIH